MKRILLALVIVVGWAVGGAAPVLADGCFICTSGSSCGQYCKYRGSDNADNRKKCTNAGCKIGGTASCPTGVNIKTCSAELPPTDRLRQLAEQQ